MASNVSSTSGNLSFTSSPSLGTVHFNGYSSGLDIDSLVSATIQARSVPITLLQNKNTKLQARLNDYNSIKTSLFSLQSAARDLTYSSSFTGRATSTSDDKVATITALNGSDNGSYTVDVTDLATTTYLTGAKLNMMSAATKAVFTGNDTSAAHPDPNAALNLNGSIAVNGVAIAVTNTDTINTILNKIGASTAGVTSALSGGKAVLTQKTAGVKPTITITGDAGILAATGLNAAPATALVAGTNGSNTQKLSSVFTGANAITSGYFSINGTFIAIDPANDTLDSVISRINQSNAGVMAYYDSNTQKLSLTQKTAGNQPITLGSGGTESNFLTQVGLTAPSAQQQGQEAQVTVNGLAVTPVNNQITLGNGNTITLTGKGKATLTVKTDIDAMVKKVKDFIDQYNSTIDSVNKKLTEKPDSTSQDASVGDLFGDSTLRNLSKSLRSFSYTVVGSLPATMQQLTQVGITTGPVGQSVTDSKTGHLSLNETTLRNALLNDPAAVSNLFGNTIDTVTADASGKGEPVGTGNGVNKTFSLAHGSVSNPQITVWSGSTPTVYTLVDAKDLKADDPAATPPVYYHQYAIDYNTGKITFGTAPANGDEITATYSYDIQPGSGKAGIFVQMAKFIDNMNQVGGTFDSLTGSNGSITQQIKYNTKRIDDLNTRLQMEQSRLYTMFNAMESQLQLLKSQGSFITSQLSSMNSSSK